MSERHEGEAAREEKNQKNHLWTIKKSLENHRRGSNGEATTRASSKVDDLNIFSVLSPQLFVDVGAFSDICFLWFCSILLFSLLRLNNDMIWNLCCAGIINRFGASRISLFTIVRIWRSLKIHLGVMMVPRGLSWHLSTSTPFAMWIVIRQVKDPMTISSSSLMWALRARSHAAM